MSNGTRIHVEMPEGAARRKILQLVLDTSQSMEETINEVNTNLQAWLAEMAQNKTWRSTLDLSIVTFGSNGVQSLDLKNGGVAYSAAAAFTPIGEVRAPTLQAAGVTPMLRAIETGLNLLTQYKAHLRNGGLDYYRPYQVLVTDGFPTDDEGHFSRVGVPELTARIVSEQNARHVLFRAFSVPGANTEVLAELAGTSNAVTAIDAVDWGRALQLVSNSVQAVLGGPAPESDASGSAPTPSTTELDEEVKEEQSDVMEALIKERGWVF